MREFKIINNVRYMRCSNCGEYFPESVEYFYKDKNCKNELGSYCRKCKIQRSRNWNKNNHEQYNQTKKNWKKNNRKHYNQLQKDWRKNNRKHYNQLQKDWRKNHPIKNKILQAKWFAKKRGLGFKLAAPIPFSKEDRKNWTFHHVNDNDVVAIPIELHDLYKGKEHRFMVNQIVSQLYPTLRKLVEIIV